MRVQAVVVGRLAGLVQARAQIRVQERLVLTASLTLAGSDLK